MKENSVMQANESRVSSELYLADSMTRVDEGKVCIATSYLLKALSNVHTLADKIKGLMQQCSIKGTIIVAHEGINFTIAGEGDSIGRAHKGLYGILGEELKFQLTYADFVPFSKLKVKIKEEVVSFREDGVRVCKGENMLPDSSRGKHLEPDEWDRLLDEDDVILLDTRNSYEYSLGHFENAVNPHIENFSELSAWVKKNIDEGKKCAMYCTGGIRCEKSTAYMKRLGFDNVYHLKGGILNYMEQRKGVDESKWKGDLFVFDDRLAIDKDLKPVHSICDMQ